MYVNEESDLMCLSVARMLDQSNVYTVKFRKLILYYFGYLFKVISFSIS